MKRWLSVAKKKKMMKREKKRKKTYDSGLFIPACLLIGILFGFITNQIPAFTLIGLGVGFLLMYFFKNK